MDTKSIEFFATREEQVRLLDAFLSGAGSGLQCVLHCWPNHEYIALDRSNLHLCVDLENACEVVLCPQAVVLTKPSDAFDTGRAFGRIDVDIAQMKERQIRECLAAILARKWHGDDFLEFPEEVGLFEELRKMIRKLCRHRTEQPGYPNRKYGKASDGVAELVRSGWSLTGWEWGDEHALRLVDLGLRRACAELTLNARGSKTGPSGSNAETASSPVWAAPAHARHRPQYLQLG